MPYQRIPIIQRVIQNIRQGTVMDVYEIVAEIAKDFPGVPLDRLEKIVSEEIIKVGGNAVWERKTPPN